MKYIASAFLIGLIFAARLVPHPANFAPVSAVILLASVYFNRKTAWLIGLIGMVLSDLVLGFYDFRIMFSVYISLTLVVWLSRMIEKEKWSSIMAVSLMGSLGFYLITNAAVWYFTPAYPKDFAGLSLAYYLGLPFLRNTIAGDWFYAIVLFGLVKVVNINLSAKPALKTLN